MGKWISAGLPIKLAKRIQSIAPNLPYYVIIARILDVYETTELRHEFEQQCPNTEDCFKRFVEWKKRSKT